MPSKRILHATKFLNLCEVDGWMVAERPQVRLVVGVVAVTAARELVLVEQFRIPVQCNVIELPAGLVGDEIADEDPATAASRELEEETGFRAARLVHLTTGPSSAGLTSETMALYLARDVVRVGQGGGVDNERINVHVVPLAGLHEWLATRVAAGCLVDTKIYAALHFIARSDTAR